VGQGSDKSMSRDEASYQHRRIYDKLLAVATSDGKQRFTIAEMSTYYQLKVAI